MSDPVLYLVGCAAPPVRDLGSLIALVQPLGWRVCVIPTPTAAEWIDLQALAAQTGFPVQSTPRHPDDSRSLPKADAALVCPATFNTVNKWTAVVSDNFALGVLNEALGLRIPTYLAPYAKPALAAHPAFGESLVKLEQWGVAVLENELVRPEGASKTILWERFVGVLRESLI
ncbi:flavoprotein [Actinokineospora diospyrosa]|uniref:Flavoprotein n=1 Tax=Actinokineospora diospyrosa TaxID=103728 RepID=A0ABT1I9J3_9PSEU|nr:flavoprotein [Actinokineospora diospyrosa]MCP2269300.1 Flavoprotein [Actinokineospora diospyrosa]